MKKRIPAYTLLIGVVLALALGVGGTLGVITLAQQGSGNRRQLAVLEETGYVLRQPGEADRRVMRVYPTEKALSALPRIQEIMDNWEEAVAAGLTAAEREKLARSCARESGVAESPELLRDGVEAIRRDGYCFNRGRNRWRIDAMSAPVCNARGRVVAALTLLGYDEDFSEERLPSVARELLDKAEQCGRIYARA